MRTIAIALAFAATLGAGAAAQNPPAGAALATPRMPDGKPDLSGIWGGAAGERGARNFDETGTISSATASRRCGPGQRKCDEHTNQSYDQEFVREDTYNGEVRFSGRWDANRPMYKPEFWDRIQELDKNTNTEDPILKCQPQGITREGPPTKIVQTAKEIIFFYGGDYFRIIPLDGRPHDPQRSKDITFWGDSVGQVGRRHTGHRLGRLQRSDVARARRLYPLRQPACRRAVPARGERAELRRDGGG